MGSFEEVDQRFNQQSQRLEYQAHRSGAFWRELNQRSRTLLPKHYEGAGCQFALHTNIRSDGGYCEYQAPERGRAPPEAAHRSVQEGI